jgi:putative transposase
MVDRLVALTSSSSMLVARAKRRRVDRLHQRCRSGVFLTILHAKAESAGREVIAATPATPPAPAPNAGTPPRRNRPTQETFHCVACGHTAHADTVAATNFYGPLVRRHADPA